MFTKIESKRRSAHENPVKGKLPFPEILMETEDQMDPTCSSFLSSSNNSNTLTEMKNFLNVCCWFALLHV